MSLLPALRVILCLACAFTCAARAEAEVLVFAAASTKNALDDVATAFEAQTGHTITVSYAASSVLARQIARGAPADLFLSANSAWMDDLDGRGLTSHRVDLLGNSLVLVGTGPAKDLPLSPDFDIAAQLGEGRLAMALVDAVPAGIYGKAALQTLGQWPVLEPHIAQTDNVRAALALVALGAAPLGIVYATDAQAEPRVAVLGAFPESSHPPIRYPIAAIGAPSPEALAFLAFVQSPEAKTLFEAQGFVVVN